MAAKRSSIEDLVLMTHEDQMAEMVLKLEIPSSFWTCTSYHIKHALFCYKMCCILSDCFFDINIDLGASKALKWVLIFPQGHFLRGCRVSVGREVRGRRRSLAHCQDCVDASPGSLYPGEVDHQPWPLQLPGPPPPMLLPNTNSPMW